MINISSDQVQELLDKKFIASSKEAMTAQKPYPSLDDQQTPVEERARFYLELNCSYCHNPKGIMPLLDFRLGTPLTDTGLLTRSVIVPGDYANSKLWQKIAGDLFRMPPTSLQPDPQAMAIMQEWIQSMNSSSINVAVDANASP